MKSRALHCLARIIVDEVLVNFCLLVGFVLGFLFTLIQQGSVQIAIKVLAQHFYVYGLSFVLISVLSFVVFWLFGIYTTAKKLSLRARIIKIFFAVTVSYLLFMFSDYLPHFNHLFPRSLLVTSWVVTVVVMCLSRVWATAWRQMTIQDISHNEIPLCMNSKAVLVIGGAGYIGSALLPKLLGAGYHVRLLDLFVYGEEPVKKYMNHPHLEVFRADFRQVDQIVKAVKGVGSVIHLGAIVGDPACALDEELTIEINLMATRMIAEICKGFGVQRFIFASTCSVYGASDEILNEASDLNPVSLYAKSKIACEEVLRKMADETFSPVILRFSTIFGFSGRTRFDLVINLLTAKAFFENKITVMGGDQWRPFLHVDDAAKAVFYALKSPLSKVRNEVFNVGGNHLNYTIMQAGEEIKRQLPEAELLDLGLDGDRRNYRVCFDKIESQLSYSTDWTLEAGVKQVHDVLKAGEVENYKDSRYSNALTLKEGGDDLEISSYYFAYEEGLLTKKVS